MRTNETTTIQIPNTRTHALAKRWTFHPLTLLFEASYQQIEVKCGVGVVWWKCDMHKASVGWRGTRTRKKACWNVVRGMKKAFKWKAKRCVYIKLFYRFFFSHRRRRRHAVKCLAFPFKQSSSECSWQSEKDCLDRLENCSEISKKAGRKSGNFFSIKLLCVFISFRFSFTCHDENRG